MTNFLEMKQSILRRELDLLSRAPFINKLRAKVTDAGSEIWIKMHNAKTIVPNKKTII